MHSDFNTKLVNTCTTKQHQKFQHRSNIDPSLSSCSQLTQMYLCKAFPNLNIRCRELGVSIHLSISVLVNILFEWLCAGFGSCAYNVQ